MACRCMRQFCFLLLPILISQSSGIPQGADRSRMSNVFGPSCCRITSNMIPLSLITNEFGTEGKKNCLHDIYTVVVEKINLYAVVSHDISPGNHLIVTITSLGARRRDGAVRPRSLKVLQRVSRNNESRLKKK